MVEPLSFAELRQPRSYLDFVEWMDDRREAFRATEESRAKFRLASGATKVFREEVFPFRVFADNELARSDAVIEFPADSGNRDVLVTKYKGQLSKQPIEIVRAVDGYEERLRMELLSAKGRAPAFGPIQKVGPKKRGYSIEARGMAERVDVSLQRVCQLVTEALALKCRRAYSARTWLLVSFDDALLRQEGHYDHVVDVARQNAIGNAFERIYLVGSISHSFCELIGQREQQISCAAISD